jgi:hypothetical protein
MKTLRPLIILLPLTVKRRSFFTKEYTFELFEGSLLRTLQMTSTNKDEN